MQWFVLRVASNKEEQVRDTLSRKMQVEGVKSVGRIMVPFEQVKRIRGGKQRVFKRKLYPGYVFMELNLRTTGGFEAAFYVIKETMGVGDFIGTEGATRCAYGCARDAQEADKPEESANIKVGFSKGDGEDRRGPSRISRAVDSIDEERNRTRDCDDIRRSAVGYQY
jgi:transcriptional antiterminator NusG